jgi:hypothetical protein
MNIRRKLSIHDLTLADLGTYEIPKILEPVINYNFKEGKIQNIDGTYKGENIKCEYKTEWEGKKDVMQFKEAGSCIKIPAIDRIKYATSFAVELNIYPQKKQENVSTRINLIEGQSIPFALMLEDVLGEDYFYFNTSVHLENGWNNVSQNFWKYEKGKPFAFRVNKDVWTKIGVVFTGSDLFIFINNKLVARQLFKNSNLVSVGNKPYHLGTFVDGKRYQFYGCISNINIWDTIPALFYSFKIDEARASGFDETINKYNALKGDQGILGKPVSYYDEKIEINEEVGQIRKFEHGNIYWSPKTGAKEVHGVILKEYQDYIKKYGAKPYEHAIKTKVFLGFPVSDESTGKIAKTRFSKFQNGAIYWSPQTGACVLPSAIYAKYLSLGADESFLGLPLKMNEAGTDSVEFEGGNIYDSYEGVFEVHGEILIKYSKNIAGIGVPTSDESPILNGQGKDTKGRVSTFTNGHIYWSANTGVAFVTNKFLNEYLKLGGPLGKLGYPLNDSHVSMHTVDNLTYQLTTQDFENGIILHKKHGTLEEFQIITELELFIGDAYCGEIDDGWWVYKIKKDVSPELYAKTFVTLHFFDKNGNKSYKVLDKGTRIPNKDHAGDHIAMHKKYTINAPKSNMWIELKIDYYDHDKWSDNDYLGTLNHVFTSETAWGLFDNDKGIYKKPLTSYNADHVSSKWVIKTDFSSRLPSVHDANRCFRDQYWWHFDNFKKHTISYEFYANTFNDVSVDENAIIHPIDKALYELIYKNIAQKGNCFGMCSEVMYAFADKSLFTFPLDKYKSLSGNHVIDTENELPVTYHEPLTRKQMYQMSSKAVWWALKKLVSFEAIKPLKVFDRVKKRLASERSVIISMIDLANGRGHSVLAYGIDESNHEKKILIADPNVPFVAYPNQPAISFIKISEENTFSHFSGLHKGDYASNDFIYPILPGSLLLEYPYSVVSDEPSTPGWYIALALAALTGGLIILAGDASVSQITANGNDFYTTFNGEKRIVGNAITDFVRLPVFDSGENFSEYFMQKNNMQNTMQFEVLGKKNNGQYKKIIRTGKAAVLISSYTHTNEKDTFKFEELDTATPFIKINTLSSKKNIAITYAVVNDVFGLCDRKVTLDLPVSKENEASFGLDSETGTIFIAPGVLLEEFEVTIDILNNNNLTTYSFKLSANYKGEIIEVFPQNTEQGKNVIIERYYEENGVREINKNILNL